VSTTIPDQPHLHNNFYNDHPYNHPPRHAHHLGNTHDDLQAASTLFRNSQASYNDDRSHNFEASSSVDHISTPNGTPATDQDGKPLIHTQHGVLSEHLAALIPNHAASGTIDAQLAASWSTLDAQQMAETQYGGMRPTLKRSYTFGTDEAFNDPAPFAAPHVQEEADRAARRLMRDLQQPRPCAQANGAEVNTNGQGHASAIPPRSQSEEDPSEDASSEEDEDVKPPKKRRKSKASKDVAQKGKTAPANRKASAVTESGKRKRATAAQKLQRENLTEAQKRSNHILSEQKRRNLIKRGFDDLHDLVPEIRNGGQSKSGILTETANFLEKIIEDNKTFQKLAGG
jgi:hypothetical protein